MKESHFFKPIREEAEKKKKTASAMPLTADEHKATEEKPMTVKDHGLSLRQSIQEKLTGGEPVSAESERTKLLSELITPDLLNEYKQILKGFNGKARKSEEHPQREFIDVNEEKTAADIDQWIGNLIREVRSHKEAGLDEEAVEELRAECWMLIDSIGNVMNTRSLERDIKEFHKEKNFETLDETEKKKQNSALAEELQGRYPFDRAEVEILTELVSGEKDPREEYNFRILAEEIARLWQEYKLGERKGELAKISFGYLAAKGAESFAPSLFQNIFAGDKFNLMVYLEYIGLGKFSDVVDANIDIRLEKVINEINHQMNERMANSLFFHEFEFIHEKSLGELYITLERGKNATQQLLGDSISKFAPALSGIAMSLAFLAKINPALGAIGLASLPVMYKIAKKQSGQMHQIYERSRVAEEKMVTRLESIKSGFEEVKTTPDVSTVAQHVGSHLNAIDDISMESTIKRRKMWLVEKLPFDAADLVAASVGFALQQSGQISGGAVLSNIIYSRQMIQPVESLVNLYFNDFARNIQDIRHAEKIFGEYEKLDLPEGEKEQERIPVSALPNFDISIKDLRYKHILRGIDLEIKQGEFVTIAGTSGAGKSTLLRNLAGLYRPDSGGVAVGGTDINGIKKYGKESLYSIMSYSNQSPQIFDGMTLRENLMLWSKNGADDAKIKKVLADLHLEMFADKLDQEVKNLSGGEKVRIGVARTLIKGAKIMLLDEPTASLDSQAATEVRKIISELNAKYPETTIICVSHDEELIKASNRPINMDELQK